VFADSRDFHLTPAQDAALEAHLELLMRWNKTVNLTAIRNREEAIERHYGESLFLAASLPPGALRIADVGSGGGFPGFPVAVLRPDCTVTLIESHQRKAVFLKETSRAMPNIRVLAKRAEDVTEAGDEAFDWVISRAVSYEDLSRVLRHLAPNAGLLTGMEAPPEGIGFVWETAIALPWGAQRFLRIGHGE
jgi:16S rRNA (guanine527-N7)-methyltransferase